MNVLGHPLVSAILEAFPGSTLRVIEPNEFEIESIMACSQPAGEYIEELGRTDMATWTGDEWMGFLETVVQAFRKRMKQLGIEDLPIFEAEIPY